MTSPTRHSPSMPLHRFSVAPRLIWTNQLQRPIGWRLTDTFVHGLLPHGARRESLLLLLLLPSSCTIVADIALSPSSDWERSQPVQVSDFLGRPRQFPERNTFSSFSHVCTAAEDFDCRFVPSVKACTKFVAAPYTYLVVTWSIPFSRPLTVTKTRTQPTEPRPIQSNVDAFACRIRPPPCPAVVNTTIAGGVSCITSVIVAYVRLGYVDITAANNGVLGGLVAITAG